MITSLVLGFLPTIKLVSFFNPSMAADVSAGSHGNSLADGAFCLSDFAQAIPSLANANHVM